MHPAQAASLVGNRWAEVKLGLTGNIIPSMTGLAGLVPAGGVAASPLWLWPLARARPEVAA